jgi:phosphoglycolate phosphatase-like HAD superfamily hydrolase
MPLDLECIRAVCFDVDGTLNDTDDVYVARLEGWLTRLRFLLPRQDLHRLARRLVMWSESPANLLISLPDWLGLDDELVSLLAWLNRGRSKPMKHFQLIPGVDAMLAHLADRFPLAVVSARDGRSTQRFVEHFSLQGFFRSVVSGQSARRTKPHPDPVLFAARAIGVPPQACLMVGDTTVDMLAARRAGAQAVGVLCGFGERHELEKAGASLVLDTTADLLSIIE